MMHKESDRHVWHLGTQPQQRTGLTDVRLNPGEPISSEQHNSYLLNTSFLQEAVRNPPFKDLQSRCGMFQLMISATSSTDAGSTQRFAQDIRRQLDDVLSALRRFADRTSHALSQRYGKDSRQREIFKQALSDEFDNQFAYRLCWHLRNYSDHLGDPISRVKGRIHFFDDPDVYSGLQLEPYFDSTQLLENYQWKRVLQKDLRQINGEFPASTVVDALQSSCKRAHSKALLAQETSIMAAVDAIFELANEATTDTGLRPMLILVQSEKSGLQIPQPIQVELADEAVKAIQEARSFLAP